MAVKVLKYAPPNAVFEHCKQMATFGHKFLCFNFNECGVFYYENVHHFNLPCDQPL